MRSDSNRLYPTLSVKIKTLGRRVTCDQSQSNAWLVCEQIRGRPLIIWRAEEIEKKKFSRPFGNKKNYFPQAVPGEKISRRKVPLPPPPQIINGRPLRWGAVIGRKDGSENRSKFINIFVNNVSGYSGALKGNHVITQLV